MTAETDNAQSWNRYGQRQLERGYMPSIPQQVRWGPWDGVGPGDAALGDIAGRRLLDIGSGPGHQAVHLAQQYGAQIDAIELSPTQHERAVTHHSHVHGVTFLRGDAAEHLYKAQPYDGAYAIGTLPYIDPSRILPALRDGLLPGAPLVFSALHTNLHGAPPTTSLTPRQEMILLRDTEPIPVTMWVLTGQLWEDLLNHHDFTVEAIELLTTPAPDNPVVHQLISARRQPSPVRRIASRRETLTADTEASA
ncbi:SAM-dependent methyltransferase [Streptomyces aurantiacus]|uniref:class I SAM-dependent methyltransferase n=1 Tax=Streptomyces aurantiacus TaxID=47760 RepID=UPI00279458B0|nr:class I SAM-dependent methyltransferase [Streptomyces aurantiacus]MDQ0773039.1 SAM-dependent methyltransferase [Streptomyces aurantiacus]